jgi:DNA-binding XRE family transcriptional regulator
MPSIGPRCHELRVRQEGRNWRIVYRIDRDAILVADVFRLPEDDKADPAPGYRSLQASPGYLRRGCKAGRPAGPEEEELRTMDKAKQKALEAAGIRFTTVQEFLGLTDEENQIVELRAAIARRTRELREKNRLTQQELASRLKSSQSRVAKIEAASPGVSLDLMFRGFFAAGGKIDDLASRSRRSASKAKVSR